MAADAGVDGPAQLPVADEELWEQWSEAIGWTAGTDDSATEDETTTVANLITNSEVNVRNDKGTTPLMLAIMRGNISAVRALIAAGAYIDIQDQDGATALHHAARREDGVEYVTAIGANADWKCIRDNDGDTPLMYAIEHGRSRECVELLIDPGNINLANNAGQTPIEKARQRNDVLGLLMEYQSTQGSPGPSHAAADTVAPEISPGGRRLRL